MMTSSRPLYATILTCVLFGFMALVVSELEGPNVCEKRETFQITTQVKTQVPFKVKTYEWCAKPPFRCPVFKTDFKPGYRNETQNSTKMIKVCCEGYAEYDGKCVSSIIHYHVTASPVGDTNSSRERIETINSSPSFVTAGDPLDAPKYVEVRWVVACFALLMVAAVLILLLFRYKKMLLQVKEELNYVTYTTERGSTGNLENPVYATVNASDPSIPNNSVRNFVVNDLKSSNTNNKLLGAACPSPSIGVRTSTTSTKSSNLEIAAALKKNRELEAENDCGASASGSSSSCTRESLPLKPLNCNLYQSRDADKEPIYEELSESCISSGRTSTNSDFLPPVTPVKTHAALSPSSSIHSNRSYTRDRNDLSGHAVYDRPRPSNLNISLSSPTASSTPIKNAVTAFTPEAVLMSTSSTPSSLSSNESSSSLPKEPVLGNKMSKKELFTAKKETSIDLQDQEPQTRNFASNSTHETHFERQEIARHGVMGASFSRDDDIAFEEGQPPLDSRDKRPANEAIYSEDVNATQDE